MLRRRNIRPYPRFGIAAFAVGLFAALVASGLFGASAVRAVDDLATAAAALVAAALCVRAAHRCEPSLRRFWSLLAAATAVWCAAELLWAFYDLVLGDPVPDVTWADAGYLSALPLAAAALLAHPGWDRGAAGRARSVLDGLAIGAALFFLVWITELGSLWRSTDLTTLAGAVALAYPIGDVVIVLLVVLVLRGLASVGGARLDLWCLLVGLLAITLSDVGYACIAEVDGYATGNLIDVGWFAGYVGIALGAVSATARSTRRVMVTQSGSASVLAPFVPLLGALALVAVEINRGTRLDRVSWITALVLVLLVLLRQSLLGVRPSEGTAR